jgi:hypothetical protein
VISRACRDTIADTAADREAAYNSRVAASSTFRSREAVARLFDGATLLEPGLVWLPEWRPDSPGDMPEDPAAVWGVAGVGECTD